AVSNGYNLAIEQGKASGIFPVLAGGTIYYHDNVFVRAIVADSGLPDPSWIATHGPADGDRPAGAFRLSDAQWTTPPGEPLTPVVTERRVFALMGRPYRQLAQQTGTLDASRSRLVALDRATGRLLFETSPDRFDFNSGVLGRMTPEQREILSDCEFAGTPVMAGGSLWLLARTATGTFEEFEQAFAVAIDPDNGQVRHATFLATAASDNSRFRGNDNGTAEPAPPLAADGELVYLPTGRGVLAAVSASDGGVRWLNLYPRNPLAAADRRGRNRNRVLTSRRDSGSLPFHLSPPVVADGRVFYRPPDASEIFVYDAGDGRALGSLPVDNFERARGDNQDRVQSVLHVDGDVLYGLGKRSVVALFWPAVLEDVAGNRFDDQAKRDWIRWIAKIPEPSARDLAPNGRDDIPMAGSAATGTIVGRPALTAEHVIIPTAQRLTMVEKRTGRRIDQLLGEGRGWQPINPTGIATEAGNVIAAGDQLVVAGPQRVSVFADADAIRTRLLAELEADPEDPQPLLKLAQVGFASGDIAEAIDRLTQAIDLSSRGGATRTQVFGSAMGFAQVLRSRGPADGELARQIEQLYALADQAARSPAQVVQPLLARGNFVESPGGTAARIDALQSILLDADLRTLTVASDNQTSAMALPRLAGDIAVTQIEEMRDTFGPAVYAALQEQASEQLEAALLEAGNAAPPTDALLTLASAYPNSNAAVRALELAAASASADAERLTIFRQLRERAARSDDAEALAEIDLQLAVLQLTGDASVQSIDAAAGQMRRVARTAPDTMIARLPLPDGSTLDGVTAEQAAFALEDIARAAGLDEAADVGIKIDPRVASFDPAAAVEMGTAVGLVDLVGTPRRDRVVVQTVTGVALFEAGETEPTWTATLPPHVSGDANADRQLHGTWIGDDLAVWDASRVALIKPGGDVAWTALATELAGQGDDVVRVSGLRAAADDEGKPEPR
ncbi:MAG: PQQ-binding-like beta-propeller repeat protein, partial [Planctomycetota bacterium]